MVMNGIKKHYPNIEANYVQNIVKVIELSAEKFPETDIVALSERVFSNLVTYKNENLLKVMLDNHNEQLNLLSKIKMQKH